MEQVAIIDLGSNSIRFIIMQINSRGAYKLVYQEKEAIRLSEGMTKDNPFLMEEAQQRALSRLKVYSHILKAQKIKTVFAVATAAVRNAKNGASFIRRVRALTGIPMTVISGTTEAKLGFSGVIHTIDLKDFLLFDLGGASIEITLVHNKKRVKSVSIPMGTVTLTERFQSREDVSPELRKKIEDFVDRKLDKLDWLPSEPLPVVGVGGTVRNLAKIHQREIGYPLHKLHNYTFSTDELYDLVDEIAGMSLKERKNLSGLSEERADIIIAGSLVIERLLKHVHAKELTISGCGLREGVFFSYYDEHYDKKNSYLKGMLISSVKNFRDTLPLNDGRHTRFVTTAALTMFDEWRNLHHLRGRSRKLLTAAALIHDAGMLINYYSHARHGAYMAANAHIFGMTHREQVICGLIIAFHHGYSGKIMKQNPHISLLSEEDIDEAKKLGMILCLAECMDNSDDQSIIQVVADYDGSVADLKVYTSETTFDVPMHAVKPFIPFFERLFGVPLVIQWFPGCHPRRRKK